MNTTTNNAITAIKYVGKKWNERTKQTQGYVVFSNNLVLVQDDCYCDWFTFTSTLDFRDLEKYTTVTFTKKELVTHWNDSENLRDGDFTDFLPKLKELLK